MSQIRPFNNADLPALVRVWIKHWSAVGPAPHVSVAMIEQALLAKTYFNPTNLLVAEVDGTVVAWCHFFPQHASRPQATQSSFFGGQRLPTQQPKTAPEDTAKPAVLGAICFDTNDGIAVCDELLRAAEKTLADAGYGLLSVGPLRESVYGYAGLAPIGHGVGVPVFDTRTSSLLSRSGFSTATSANSMVVSTAQYRPPVNREAIGYRRSTRIEHDTIVPTDPNCASAMAHLDIERHKLVEHRTGTVGAYVDLWVSDQQAQVMDCSEAVLSLRDETAQSGLQPQDSFLIASVIQSLANRRIFSVETAVDADTQTLATQLSQLGFETRFKGHRWEKNL